MQALADQAALALDNARLHEEAEQRRREAEVLAVLARTINESLDVDTVLQRVAEGARELSASDMARVALRDPQLGRFAFRYWVGTRYEDYGGFPLTADRGIAGRVITTGRPFRTENWLEDPRIRKPRDLVAVVLTEGIVTELMVPITIGDRVEGLISVNNRTARVFTDRDETVLQRLADHAAIAIQNARLYSQSREFGDRLRGSDPVDRHSFASAAPRMADRRAGGCGLGDRGDRRDDHERQRFGRSGAVSTSDEMNPSCEAMNW